MTFQRVAFVAAIFLFANNARDVSGFGVNNPLLSNRLSQSITCTSTAIRAEVEPSASEKAAELRKKAEEAKRKAEELKKVAEKKAADAMVAVKKANEQNAASAAEPAAAAATPEPKKPTPPAPKSDTPKDKASTRVIADASDGAIIPVNSETVEFTSGILGGAVALAFGASPVLAIVAAAATNYVSKKEDLGEVNEFVQAISKASLNTFNWFAKLDSKYTILGKLSESLDKSLNDLKNSENENAETIKKIEETVSKTTKQIQQLADEIDFFEGGKQLLGAAGDVVETSIDKAFDANKEYKLTDRAAEAAKKAVEKAKENRD